MLLFTHFPVSPFLLLQLESFAKWLAEQSAKDANNQWSWTGEDPVLQQLRPSCRREKLAAPGWKENYILVFSTSEDFLGWNSFCLGQKQCHPLGNSHPLGNKDIFILQRLLEKKRRKNKKDQKKDKITIQSIKVRLWCLLWKKKKKGSNTYQGWECSVWKKCLYERYKSNENSQYSEEMVKN